MKMYRTCREIQNLDQNFSLKFWKCCKTSPCLKALSWPLVKRCTLNSCFTGHQQFEAKNSYLIEKSIFLWRNQNSWTTNSWSYPCNKPKIFFSLASTIMQWMEWIFSLRLNRQRAEETCEPCHKKICLQGLRPGKTQTSLLSFRD